MAILGGGISGCASSYFLRDIFGENLDLTVFEKSDHIGGRLETIKVNGRDYEIGGQSLHSTNFYMNSFLKALGII